MTIRMHTSQKQTDIDSCPIASFTEQTDDSLETYTVLLVECTQDGRVEVQDPDRLGLVGHVERYDDLGLGLSVTCYLGQPLARTSYPVEMGGAKQMEKRNSPMCPG